MPRIIETTVYTIDELSDAAKENARIWYRDQGLHDEWYDFVYEDFETICQIIGVTLATTPVRLYGGGTRDKPQIYWSGFSNQGDGASFAGRYSYARGAARAIRAHAPKDEELHRIADELQAIQRRNFHQLHASIRQQGRYCHEYTMAIEVERDSPTWQPHDRRRRGRRDRGAARPGALALPPAPIGVRAPDDRRSRRRDRVRECLDVYLGRHAVRLIQPA